MSDNHTFEATVTWPADTAQKLPPDPAFSRNAVLGSPGHPPVPGSSPTVFGGEAAQARLNLRIRKDSAHAHQDKRTE